MYGTIDDLKLWLSQGTADTTDEVQLYACGSAAAPMIDEYADRTFVAAGTVVSARYFPIDDTMTLRVDDIGNVAGLTVALDLDFDGTYETTLTTSNLLASPPNAIAKGRPITQLRVVSGQRFAGYLAKVEACWGWPSTPSQIKTAWLIQAARLHSRRRAPLGSIQAPELGGGERLLERLDPDVIAAVQPFRRSWNGLTV